MNRDVRLLTACAIPAMMLCGVSLATAQTAPSLGAAQSFAVVAGSTITNTGPTVLGGDLGLSPGSVATGFPPGTFSAGSIHAADALALSAQNSVTLAYNSLASEVCTQDLTGQDLGGMTLTPGVYCFSSSAQLTGNLTLNGGGNAAAVFIFKVGSSLTTASGSSVSLIGSASPCNLFWQVGSSATLGTATTFVGNLLALTSITVTTGASISGRALARNGAVTLDSNNVTATCATTPGPACPAIAVAPPTAPGGVQGVPYSQLLTGSGGAAPYTFGLSTGTLPAGLTLTAAGLLAGTPTVAATSSFTVRALDVNACAGSLAYTLLISPVAAGCPAITLTPATPPNGTVGAAYSQTIVGSGGTGPYSFSLTTGTLPAGLTLTPAGVLSGTPTAGGTSTFTMRGTDANGCFAEAPVTMLISTAVPMLPREFLALLALAMASAGYLRMRRRALR